MDGLQTTSAMIPSAGRWLRAAFALLVTGMMLFLTAAAVADTEVKRIVSLAPSVTEILFALGVGDRVVGVSTYCDYPPEVAGVDRVGTFLLPNVERILAHKPDLVIAVPSPGNRAPVETLENLKLRVLIVDPQNVSAVLAAVRTIADAVGVGHAGVRLAHRIEEEVADVVGKLEGASSRRVLMLVGRRPLVAVGSGTYQDDLIRLAHGINVAAKTGEQWPTINLEFLIAEAPDVIIETAMGTEEDAGVEGRRAFWQGLTTIPAVRDGRIYGYGAYTLLRPGPRIAEALEMIARFVHPERLGGPCPKSQSGGKTRRPEPVIPAQAGIQVGQAAPWIPAPRFRGGRPFAGMTRWDLERLFGQSHFGEKASATPAGNPPK